MVAVVTRSMHEVQWDQPNLLAGKATRVLKLVWWEEAIAGSLVLYTVEAPSTSVYLVGMVRSDY